MSNITAWLKQTTLQINFVNKYFLNSNCSMVIIAINLNAQ